MLRPCLSNVWRNFQGHLAEVKTSVTVVLWGRSSPRIMHKFTLWIDLNVTRWKCHTRSQRIWVLWIKCPVYTLPTGLLERKSHGAGRWLNLPFASQRAEGRERDGSQQLAPFPVCSGSEARLHACPTPASDPAAGERAGPLPGSCPCLCLFPRQSSPWNDTFALADYRAITMSNDSYPCTRDLCKL